jgi:hypothetical protein
MLIYITAPYRANTRDGIKANINAARNIAGECWLKGHDVIICPHANSSFLDEVTGLPDGFWLSTSLNLLKRCDAVVVTPDWETSQGTATEIEYAKQEGIPVYAWNEIPDLHPVEVRSPLQVDAFMATIMRMYRLHLSKNSDYSPANILATGQIGVMVRLSDKILRLLNLAGFRITIESSDFELPTEPNHESIDDTLIDAANYAVIGLLQRNGQWGQ